MGTFFKGVFSDAGTPSFSRTATGLLAVAAVFWVTVIVWRTSMLPDLAGLALFIAVLYGANVAGSAAKSIGGGE